MSNDTNEFSLLTSSAFRLSNATNNVSIATTPLINEANGLPTDDMVEIIKLKDLQIVKLQATIDQQSIQIQHQTDAIENMQKQMSELSASLAKLVQRSEKPPPAQNVAPIFLKTKNSTRKPAEKMAKQHKTASAGSASITQHSWPSLAQPNPKRPRHLLDDELSNNTNTKTSNDDANGDKPNNISVSAVTDDITDVNVNNIPNDNNISPVHVSDVTSDDESAENEQFADPEKEWTNVGFNENSNFVNFKKNSIVKDKDVTPIEISIKNNEKGSLHSLLIQHFDNNSFLWSNAGKRSIRINPFTQTVKDGMIRWLQGRKYQFHTFLNKENKPNAFIIRGLPDSVDHSHISNALQQAGIKFSSLERHSTGYTRFHQKQSDLWRVTTPHSVSFQHFKAINGILNVKIRVEVLKRSPVLQCKNCQLFFHSAAGCHRKFRCVKCDKEHPPAACPRNTNRSLPVVCCNCHKNHSANDLQHCEFFAKHIKPIIDKREKMRNKSAVVSTKASIGTRPDLGTSDPNFFATVKPKVSFSSVVAQNSNSTKKLPSNRETKSTSAANFSKTDLKNLLIQNMHLMTAQQEIMQRLSCLIV